MSRPHRHPRRERETYLRDRELVHIYRTQGLEAAQEARLQDLPPQVAADYNSPEHREIPDFYVSRT
jgi:hypothetical protein